MARLVSPYNSLQPDRARGSNEGSGSTYRENYEAKGRTISGGIIRDINRLEGC